MSLKSHRLARTAQPEPAEVPLIGASELMHALNAQIDRAARSDAKVLITGETGAGKEVVARLIHCRSARRAKPILTLNCAGIPESLLESELFGHVRGSFTGAIRDKRGLFEAANGGTVFLDEIGEMSLRMQAVLLRFLQSGEIQRVGADRAQKITGIRLICATNRDLKQEVAAERFREDFYFRLNVVSIVVPPLRDRLSDVPLLIDFLLGELLPANRSPISLAPETIALLSRYSWPGNVRELRNVLERLIVNARSGVIQPSDLPEHIRATVAPAGNGHAHQSTVSLVHALAARMLVHGESFWTVVDTKDLSRDDLKKLVRIGLDRTRGSYRTLVDLFNMPATDHARFLKFLQEHDCHLQPVGLHPDSRPKRRADGAGEA